MNPILGNMKCIFFLLLRGREERKLPLWVQAGKHLGLKAGRGQECPFPSERPLDQLCDIEKPVQSFCSESISNQVSALPSFSGTFYLEILDLCKGLHSSLSQCWFHCGFSCWEILLMIFLFPTVRAEWPKYLFQILFNGRAVSFLAGVALEAPAFPPLSQVPAVMPAAEVSAGVCARPEPCSASRLRPRETKNEESSAQG